MSREKLARKYYAADWRYCCVACGRGHDKRFPIYGDIVTCAKFCRSCILVADPAAKLSRHPITDPDPVTLFPLMSHDER